MASPDRTNGALSETAQGFLSLAVVAHLFVVFLGLAGNLLPSPLVERLNQVGSWYGQSLNLVPRRASLQLTHATVEDDDHLLELEAVAGRRVMTLPLDEPGGGFQRLRLQRLSDQIARYVATEREPPMSVLLQGLASHGLDALQTERLVIRCLRIEPHPIEPTESVSAGSAETIYAADAFRTSDGRTMLLKRSEQAEVAPSTAESDP